MSECCEAVSIYNRIPIVAIGSMLLTSIQTIAASLTPGFGSFNICKICREKLVVHLQRWEQVNPDAKVSIIFSLN